MAPLVAVVDDDVSVRKSLDRLIRSVRLDVEVFASAEEFLKSAPALKPDCLVLDVSFITAHGSDERARLEAASDWTVAYFIKPFSADELLDAVDVALKWTSGGEDTATKP
jgi:FixJ family two-component response regulator